MPRLLNLKPNRSSTLILGVLPFLIIVMFYFIASGIRLSENPNDKLLPSFSSFTKTVTEFSTEPSPRTGEVQLWSDTSASLKRLGLGLGLSALIGLVFGVVTGTIPVVRASLAPLIAAFSMIPPLAVLPILFIIFGLDELSKVVLICFGVAPFIMRDLMMRVGEMPNELMIKAQTLGANTWQVILRVVLPQMWPRLLDSIRLSLGSAWLFMIAAEAIASTDGLGYRIFLVRRYLAMDTILPYVIWITILAFSMDYVLKHLTYRLFPWYQRSE